MERDTVRALKAGWCGIAGKLRLELGHRFVKIEGGGSEVFVDRFSARLAALLGQAMTVSHQHL